MNMQLYILPYLSHHFLSFQIHVQVWDRLPHLKAVVQYTGEIEGEKPPNVYTVSVDIAFNACSH